MGTVQLECILFRKRDNIYEFLLLKRVSEKGGFWQPVCGGLEKGDKSKLDAAYREIFEETGIVKNDIIRTLEKVHYFEMNRDYLTDKPIPTIKEYVFGFEVKPDVKIKIDFNVHNEHEEYKWVSFEQAIKLLKWEDNKEAFRKLNSILT